MVIDSSIKPEIPAKASLNASWLTFTVLGALIECFFLGHDLSGWNITRESANGIVLTKEGSDRFHSFCFSNITTVEIAICVYHTMSVSYVGRYHSSKRTCLEGASQYWVGEDISWRPVQTAKELVSTLCWVELRSPLKNQYETAVRYRFFNGEIVLSVSCMK